MRCVDDALHLGIAEMLLQAHRARVENSAGRHELDDVDALGGEAANDLLALLDAGTDGGAEMRRFHRLR